MVFIDKLFGTGVADALRQDAAPAASSAWRCVEIRTDSEAPCAAASELTGRRFLPDEIPELPLPGCDAESCRCSYKLHNDRRRLARRDGPTEDLNASLLRREDVSRRG